MPANGSEPASKPAFIKNSERGIASGERGFETAVFFFDLFLYHLISLRTSSASMKGRNNIFESVCRKNTSRKAALKPNPVLANMLMKTPKVTMMDSDQ